MKLTHPGRATPANRLAVLLLTACHVLVRRRLLRVLLRRDSASFASRWPGKLLVAAVLVAVPVAMVVTSLGGGRYGRYFDDSWKALLMLIVLAASYVASRRLVLTMVIGAVTVGVVSWALSPDLAVTRNGDAEVLARIDQQGQRGWLAGNHAVAVAEIDLKAGQPVRLAGIGANDTTPMEVGSMTKAMTGLVIADAMSRGEVRMDVPVATYLPRLEGSPAGTVTLQELV
ncbi:MAG TPA: serine hydrolase domain-containing protein, partial [Propionibacteriaceae bacterium]